MAELELLELCYPAQTMTPISLHSDSPADAHLQSLAQHGRTRVDNIFSPESASVILTALSQETPWHLAYSDVNSAAKELSPAELEALSAESLAEILQGVHQRAGTQYQYAYKFFPIINAILQNQLDPGATLYQIATFLNGTEFLKFARRLTGDNSIVKFNPVATRYDPGHFLNMHDDFGDRREAHNNGQRLYAVVFGFSRDWSSNWGGGTNFFAEADSREAVTWYPGFNTMTIFKVPALHSVSPVAPFAQTPRYSITGWLRSDPAIQRPDLAF